MSRFESTTHRPTVRKQVNDRRPDEQGLEPKQWMGKVGGKARVPGPPHADRGVPPTRIGEEGPTDGDLRHRAAIQEKSGDFEGAVRSYQNLLESTPDDAALLRSLGDLLRDLGKLEDALRCFDRLWSLGDNEAILPRMELLMETGRRDAALRKGA